MKAPDPWTDRIKWTAPLERMVGIYRGELCGIRFRVELADEYVHQDHGAAHTAGIVRVFPLGGPMLEERFSTGGLRSAYPAVRDLVRKAIAQAVAARDVKRSPCRLWRSRRLERAGFHVAA